MRIRNGLNRFFPVLLCLIGMMLSSCTDPDTDTGDVSGTIEDASGEPLGSVEVKIVGPEEITTITENDGTFEFVNVEVGNYKVTASKDGYKTESKNVTVTENRVADVDFSLDGDDDDDDEIATKTGNIQGKVRDKDNNPITGANVSIEGKMAITTDSDGSYLLNDLSVGEHSITASKDGFALHDGKVTVEADKTTTYDIVLMSPGGIQGTIHDVNTLKPIAEVLLKLDGVTFSVTRSVTTESDGSYLFANLAPGQYKITIEKDPYPAFIETISVGDTLTTKDFVLGAIGIHGRVTDTEGEPIANANVKLDDTGGSTSTDSDGRFAFDGLSKGDHKITITKTGYKTFTDTIYVDRIVNTTHQMEKLPGIDVTVLDIVTNKPIANAKISLTPNVGGSLMTDSNGKVLFLLDTPGSYAVRAEAYGYEIGTENATVVLGKITVVTLQLQLKPEENMGLTPDRLDFGENRDMLQLTITNIGKREQSLNWTIADPTDEWLTVKKKRESYIAMNLKSSI